MRVLCRWGVLCFLFEGGNSKAAPQRPLCPRTAGTGPLEMEVTAEASLGKSWGLLSCQEAAKSRCTYKASDPEWAVMAPRGFLSWTMMSSGGSGPQRPPRGQRTCQSQGKPMGWTLVERPWSYVLWRESCSSGNLSRTDVSLWSTAGLASLPENDAVSPSIPQEFRLPRGPVLYSCPGSSQYKLHYRSIGTSKLRTQPILA